MGRRTEQQHMHLDHRPLLVAFAVLVAVLAVVAIILVSSSQEHRASPGLSADGRTNVADVNAAPGKNSALQRCVELCKSARALGADFTRPYCIVEDLGGYGCSMNPTGPTSVCQSASRFPQIVLNSHCSPWT